MRITNYYVPKDYDDAYFKLTENTLNQIVGGGAWLRLGKKEIDTLIDCTSLKGIAVQELADKFVIDASATLKEVEDFKGLKDFQNGILVEAIHSVMGIGIRNLATFGGSVMGKFSFSDLFPVLLVMDTTLHFHKQGEIALEDFLETKKFEKDILKEIHIKKSNGRGFFKKVRSTSLDFAVLSVAVNKIDNQFSIAIGSRPGIAKLAKEAIKYLNNQDNITDETIEKVKEIIMQEISFSDNSRGTKTYREELAKVYTARGIKEVM